VPVFDDITIVMVCCVIICLVTVTACIQKFPDWPPGVRTANGKALCH